MSLLVDDFGIAVVTSESDLVEFGIDTWGIVTISEDSTYSMEIVCKSIGDALSIPLPRVSNWDALYADLREMDWVDGISHNMLFSDGPRLFELGSIDQVVLLKLLSGAATYWKKRGREMRIVLIGDEQLARLVQMVVVPWNVED